MLARLSASQGNLLEDVALINVLADTKAKAEEVQELLDESKIKQADMNQKREIFRPVAKRGSIMYFIMLDMTLVANPITLQPSGWMYNSSLIQFFEVFDLSCEDAEKAALPAKRVVNISNTLTYRVYRYVNRGLFVRDQLLFKLLFTLKIEECDNRLDRGDIALFLKGGSALDISQNPNCFKWMPDNVFLNIRAIKDHAFGSPDLANKMFNQVQDSISRNETLWREWFDLNEPEMAPVPDFEDRLTIERDIGSFMRLCLVRCLREDRSCIAAGHFIIDRLTSATCDGNIFMAPVTDVISEIYDSSTCRKPILYLLTSGSDPTAAIDEFAKQKKNTTAKVSMGEGQEVPANSSIDAAFLAGTWVILQNCHLGIGFMNKLEDKLSLPTSTPELENFRLWLTSEITIRFPIGLLQISIKVTLEPPQGLRAGLQRSPSAWRESDCPGL